jgi:hypothetical protein
MVDIQIVTNGKLQTDVASYWQIKDENQFLEDGITPNPNFNTWQRATLAQIILKWTRLKFPNTGTFPLEADVDFGLAPFKDSDRYQVVIEEEETPYVDYDGVSWVANTGVAFHVYFKFQEFAPSTEIGNTDLDNLLTEIESIWMNYQNFSINGLHTVMIQEKYYDTDLMRQAEESNYKKSFKIICVYQVARTTTIDPIVLTYEDPKIAGGFRTN